MSSLPNEIPDFGSVAVKPAQNPDFVPGNDFTTEDYFVWTRCDGTASLKDIVAMVGLGPDRTIEILRNLRRRGAVLLPGETPASVVRPSPPASASEELASSAASEKAAASRGVRRNPKKNRRPTRPREDLIEVDLSAQSLDLHIDPASMTGEETAAMASVVELSDSEKMRILAMVRRVSTGDPFAILGVSHDADKRRIKRAYFKISKEFHPDRHYGHELGPFADMLSRIFEAASAAFATLGDERKRRALVETAGQPSHSEPKPQTVEEHAAELFEAGCKRELAGEMNEALRFFAAAIRAHQRPQYLRRAALCALRAAELSLAEEYAKKAAHLRPDDPSYVRVLADVYRATDKLGEAEDTLVHALGLRTENDVLVAELKADLEAVRNALRAG